MHCLHTCLSWLVHCLFCGSAPFCFMFLTWLNASIWSNFLEYKAHINVCFLPTQCTKEEQHSVSVFFVFYVQGHHCLYPSNAAPGRCSFHFTYAVLLNFAQYMSLNTKFLCAHLKAEYPSFWQWPSLPRSTHFQVGNILGWMSGHRNNHCVHGILFIFSYALVQRTAENYSPFRALSATSPPRGTGMPLILPVSFFLSHGASESLCGGAYS